MKVLFVFLIAVTALFSEHIRWQSDFDKALFEAKKAKKEIMLLVLEKECATCKNIFVEVFGDKEVQKKVNKKYIAVVVFFENKNSYPIELFYTQSFPTLFFVSSKDESYLRKPLRVSFTKEELLEGL